AWGFTVWTLAGVVAVISICKRWSSVLVAAAFVSPVALGCWGLGQTAVLTTAAILALMAWDAAASRVGASELPIAATVVRRALTAQAPLAFAAATALLAGRRYRTVVTAIALTVISTALLLSRLGVSGITSYVDLLTHYDVDTAAPAFTWSLVPETM